MNSVLEGSLILIYPSSFPLTLASLDILKMAFRLLGQAFYYCLTLSIDIQIDILQLNFGLLPIRKSICLLSNSPLFILHILVNNHFGKVNWYMKVDLVNRADMTL